MSAAASTFDIACGLADALRQYAPKEIAKRIGASPRTVENWLDGVNSPTLKHVAAMLHDDELGPGVLRAIGLDRLAKQHEILSLERRIDALKQAEQRHKEEAHAIRENLGVGRARDPAGGRSGQRDGDEAAARSRVVSRSGEE